jgi:hypothetical protein
MSREDTPPRRSALLSFKFLGTALVGSLVMALVSAFAPLPGQIAILGAFVSILAGLFLSYLEQDEEREQQRAELIEKLSVPLALAPDPDLYARYTAICRALTELARQADPVLRQIALLKLSSVAGQLGGLADGTVVFSATEGWRTVYEQLLRSPDIRQYRSIAWVRSKDYWQDQPGRQSMQVNFEAAHRGVLIERIVILRDELWPRSQALPAAEVLPWIEEQHNHGLWLSLVREADLESEPDLLADVGIYGQRAVGMQELDERSRTVRFTMLFDPQAVQQAEERWRRLALFGTSFRSLLDQPPAGG